MFEEAARRIFDVVIASVALVVTLPLWVVIAAAIRTGSRGPVIYRAERIGKGGGSFELYKFRTMVVDSGEGPRVTRTGDPRVTAAGRWLRHWKLDELPQLVNVIRGDMSLVGPRPEDPRYVALYSDEQRRVLSVRPGIVGPAVLRYRHEESLLAAAGDLETVYVTTVMPDKLKLDLEYLDGRSLGGDLKILIRAAASLFLRPD